MAAERTFEMEALRKNEVARRKNKWTIFTMLL